MVRTPTGSAQTGDEAQCPRHAESQEGGFLEMWQGSLADKQEPTEERVVPGRGRQHSALPGCSPRMKDRPAAASRGGPRLLLGRGHTGAAAGWPCPSAGSASPSASAAGSLLQLLQALQVRAVDGDFLAVPLPQGIMILLHHLQLVQGRVVQLVARISDDPLCFSTWGPRDHANQGWRAGSRTSWPPSVWGKDC